MNLNILYTVGFNLYLFILLLPLGSFLGFASIQLWLFSLATLSTYHFINHYIKIEQIFENLSLSKIPQYVITAALVLIFGPSYGLSKSLLTFASLAAPFIFDAALIAFTIAIGSVIRLFTSNGIYGSNEDQIKLALIQGNEARALQIINRINNPQSLLTLALTAMHYPNDTVFNSLSARLKSLGVANLALNNNQLLRAAAHHNLINRVKTLLNDNHVKENAHAQNNEALREACAGGYSAIVDELISIPSVLTNINFNQNEAVRLAERSGHWDLVVKLLAVPAVSNYVIPDGIKLIYTDQNKDQYGKAPTAALEQEIDDEDHNEEVPTVTTYHNDSFYNLLQWRPTQPHQPQNHVLTPDNDLKHMMRSEGAMTQQNNRQKTALDDMKARYNKSYKQKGEQAIFNEIKEYILAEYENKPATLWGFPLPLSLGKAAKLLTWLIENKPYYRHVAHTAYRFLFLQPNPWRGFLGGYNTQLSGSERTQVAYMWLAATDSKKKLPDGQTRESLLQEFMQAMYELARAHNYDRTRTVIRKRKDPITNQISTYLDHNDHYDDLEGDKPTCGGGVNQRITQFYMVFLNERPETRPLTADIIRRKFQEEMINESKLKSSFYNKLKTFDKATLTKLEQALSNLFDINLGHMEDIEEDERAVIKLLNFTDEEVKSFIKDCQKYFGTDRVSLERPEDQKIAYQHHRFKSFEQMIKHLAKSALQDYYNDIKRNIINLNGADNSNPALRFSGQETVNPANDSIENEPANRNVIGLTA